MPLLAGVFLRDLQLYCCIRVFDPAKQRRHRLAYLKVDRAIFDLDDDVVIELAIQRMKDVVSGFGAVVLEVGPV